MILVVCVNAAIDVTYQIDGIVPGSSHRVRSVRHRAGGKGVNVARVLTQLAEPVTLLAFAGPSVGELLRADLVAAGIRHMLVPTAEDTRRTVTVVDPSDATVFNEPGPLVSAQEWALFVEEFRRLLVDADFVVLSGSLPPGLADTVYCDLVALARAAGVPSIVDADGPALRHALSAEPELVKPNHHELGALLGRPLPDLAAARAAAAEVASRGPRTVLVSRGADGLYAATPAGDYLAEPAQVVAGNPTGAGDSLVAAVAAGLVRNQSWPDILSRGAAISAAAVAVDVAGEFDAALAARLRPSVRVTRLPDLRS